MSAVTVKPHALQRLAQAHREATFGLLRGPLAPLVDALIARIGEACTANTF